MKRRLLALLLAGLICLALAPAAAALTPGRAQTYLDILRWAPEGTASYLTDFSGDGAEELLVLRPSPDGYSYVYQIWADTALISSGSDWCYDLTLREKGGKAYLARSFEVGQTIPVTMFTVEEGQWVQGETFLSQYDPDTGTESYTLDGREVGREAFFQALDLYRVVQELGGYGYVSPHTVLDTLGDDAARWAPTAYPFDLPVNIDGNALDLQMYALRDASGNLTNYVKLRDVAFVLDGTAARFNVTWDGAVSILPGEAYVPTGLELYTPYSGEQTYTLPQQPTLFRGTPVSLDAFVLHDLYGGGYTYYKLRDLGRLLGFNVGWTPDSGVFIESNRPYDPAN